MMIAEQLDPELDSKVRARLSPGESLSDYVQRAIVEMIQREDQEPTAHGLWERHFDGWGSSEDDRCKRVKDIVREKVHAKLRAR